MNSEALCIETGECHEALPPPNMAQALLLSWCTAGEQLHQLLSCEWRIVSVLMALLFREGHFRGDRLSHVVTQHVNMSWSVSMFTVVLDHLEGHEMDQPGHHRGWSL